MKKLQTAIKGIDVSHWQGDINWKAVYNNGVRFTIIKVGGFEQGGYSDSRFIKNFREASALMSVGVYYYAGINLLNGGAVLANHCLKLIEAETNKKLNVFIDVEELKFMERRDLCTQETINFCETIKAAGHTPGIYASDISGFKQSLQLEKLTQYNLWVARYGMEPIYVKDYVMWQYTGSGSVPGIETDVDLNYCYYDIFTEKTTKPVTNELIQEIMNGKWGNGEVRKQKLIAAGYDYDEVQEAINKYIAVAGGSIFADAVNAIKEIKRICTDLLEGLE